MFKPLRSFRRRRPPRILPRLEVLEERLCPASTLTVSNLNDTGSGSLRDALTRNVTDGGGDTIEFGPGLNGTLNLGSTLTNSGKAVTITNPNGDNITISGQNAVRDLNLTGGTGVAVNISG